MQTCTLAVDIGASSGRHIVGTVQDGRIVLQEVYRFENGVRRKAGHLCWDIDTLAREVVNGLRAAHDAGFAPATIGIDTWAVDFVLLDEAGQRIGDAVAYRDERTEGIREALEKEYGLTFAEHYARTGIQYQPFNTVYQLMALKKEHPEQLAAAKTFLMVPDYLNYLLCGVAANEYTNASTTALVGADSKDWDDALLQRLGLPRGIFQPIKTAGTVLGHLTPAVRDLDVPVVLVNVQKKKAPDYANTDIPTWLGELYACGAVGEMVADLERAGKRHAVITGVVEGGDPVVAAEINDWCKAAQVRRRFRDTNLAQIGRPYPGMMDLYIDETNLYNRMWLYTKQFDWEKMWAIADNITDENAIRAKAQDILDTFDIEGGGTIEKVWDMARYVVAFEQWVKDEKIAFVASHYDGFAQGKAGVLDSMLIPAFSMLIKQGVACAVEGDIKVSMAMSILKTISGCGQLSEMYSIDFNEDICIIGHSGSGDADISQAKKPTMKIVPVFHGKTGGGYLTQFYPPVGDVTYLGITQDKDGHFKFVVAEGVNEPGPIFTFGDTNMRTRFSCGAREFCNRWSEAGPTHHMAAAPGRHIDTILKVAKIFNVPVDIVTR